MSIFLIKSLLSIPVVLLTLLGMLTMFEIFGRNERRYNAEKLRRLHSISGILYIILFILISYFCVRYIADTQTELSPRGAIHALLSSAIAVLLFIKIIFVKPYRQFYGYAKALGIVIAVLSLLMAGSSAGYYLFVYGAMENNGASRQPDSMPAPGVTARKWIVLTDTESIKIGKEIFDSKCIACHDPFSTRTIVGPGHKGIMKHALLPSSKRPATPENIANQLRNPVGRMPSFAYLSDKEILNIIAYMNTL